MSFTHRFHFLWKGAISYVYLLPFDNIQNDPAVEWIAAGLSDMAREEIKNVMVFELRTRKISRQ